MSSVLDEYVDRIIEGVNASVIEQVQYVVQRIGAIDGYAAQLVKTQQQTADYLFQIWVMVVVLICLVFFRFLLTCVQYALQVSLRN